MTSFTGSSHRLYWLFDSQQHLDEHRLIHHQNAVERHQLAQLSINLSNGQLSVVQSSPSPSSSASSPTQSPDQSINQSPDQLFKQPTNLPVKNFSALTLDDQKVLVQHFSVQISNFCLSFTPIIPAHVRRAAQSFFARFFVRKSVLDFAVKYLMLASLFLASKTEEHYIPLSRLAEKILDPKKGETLEGLEKLIVRLEIPLIDGCGFHLKVFQPEKAIRGFVDALVNDASVKQSINQPINPKALIHKSNTLVDFVYLTDAVLLFSHSLMGFTAVVMAASESLNQSTNQNEPASTQSNNQSNPQLIDQWVEKLMSIPLIDQSINLPIDVLKQRVQLVAQYINDGRSINQATLKSRAAAVSKKLRGLVNHDQSTDESADRQKAADKAARKSATRETEMKKQQQMFEQPANQAIEQPNDDDDFVLKRRKLSPSTEASLNSESQRRSELRVKHQHDMQQAFPGFGF